MATRFQRLQSELAAFQLWLVCSAFNGLSFYSAFNFTHSRTHTSEANDELRSRQQSATDSTQKTCMKKMNMLNSGHMHQKDERVVQRMSK